MKSRVIPFIVSVLASTIAVGAQAQSYQFQTDADYGHVSENGVDLDAVTIKQQYFLSPLQASENQPWKEAAFLNRSSSLNLDYSRINTDINGFGDQSLSGWGFGGEYMSQAHNFYGALQTRFFNGDDTFMAVGKVGYFVQPNWLVSLDAYHVNPEGEGSDTYYGASTKVIVPVMMGDHLVLTASVADWDEENGYTIGADYYIRPNWSVGASYRDDMPMADLNFSPASLVGKGTELRSEYFVTPQLALRASYNRVDLGQGHTDQYGLGASYRF